MNRVCLLFLVLLIGCGGGSSGTGTKSSFEGIVQTVSGDPYSGATVTLLETGDSTTTDGSGQFILESEFSKSEATFEIERNLFKTQVAVSDLDASSNTFSLNITVDPDAGTASIRGADIRVKFVGICDNYFENNRTIRQSTQVPRGTNCTLQVTTKALRGGLPNREFQLQFRACSDSSNWNILAQSETNDVGIGSIQFPFVDDATHCIYRVLVPLNDNEIRPISFKIQTFTFQRN